MLFQLKHLHRLRLNSLVNQVIKVHQGSKWLKHINRIRKLWHSWNQVYDHEGPLSVFVWLLVVWEIYPVWSVFVHVSVWMLYNKKLSNCYNSFTRLQALVKVRTDIECGSILRPQHVNFSHPKNYFKYGSSAHMMHGEIFRNICPTYIQGGPSHQL